MKAKMAVVMCGVGLAVLWAGYSGQAQAPAADPMARIGMVSIMKVMRESQRFDGHEKEVGAEQDKISQDLAKMDQDVKADQAKLNVFKAGSPEYLEQYKVVVEKQARFQAQQEYYRQASTSREKQWTEQFFKEILETTARIAEQKGLALVLERTEPEFPIPADRLVATLNTHKVLYAKGCVDITGDVMAALDKK